MLKKLKLNCFFLFFFFWTVIYEDLQDLLDITHTKDVLFITGDWNTKVGNQELPGITGKFGLVVQNESGQRLTVLPRERTVHSFSSSSLSAIRVVSSACLRLLIFLPAILIPACASSSPAFLMMYSACKLNKQGDNIQPCRTPFPIWNQSVVPCPVLTVASWPAYRFLKRQVRWSGIPISYGRNQRRTKEPLDESERGEWKSWLKAQHSEN